MLDQKMYAANLATQILCSSIVAHITGMVLAHIVFECFAIRAGRRFPSGVFGGSVEIVRKILAVGMSNLPSSRQTGRLDRSQLFCAIIRSLQRDYDQDKMTSLP